MSWPRNRLRRWLAVALAWLALISVDGLHAATHFGQDAPDQLPSSSGHLELHAGDCPHRPHVPAHPDHHCPVCHTGSAPVLAAPVAVAVQDSPSSAVVREPAAWFAGSAGVPGILGARGPPAPSA